MTDRKLPELFAERPIRSDFARPRRRIHIPYAVRRIMTVAILFLIIGGGLYWKFSPSSPSAPGEIPTIKAEGPYKQRPEQPGGLEIPNQDVQVYQEIGNSAPPQPEVEHLLPPPETPTAPPPKLMSPPPTPQQLESLTPEKKAATTATQPETMPAPTAAPLTPVASAAAPAQAVEATPVMPSAPPPAKTQTAAATTAPKTIDDVLNDVTQTKSTAGHAAIQLAAVQDQDAAQATMNKLQTRYASILGTTQLHIIRADLGAKGIYYRIQSSTLSDDRAKSICAKLKTANAGCIIVHP